MSVLNKQSCPTCGQSVNEREIGLFKGMVTALFDVWQWCKTNDVHEFTRKDIKQFLIKDNEIARFGDWVLFGGLVYKESKGHYGLNMERVADFFSNELAIPTSIIKNPITRELRKENYKTIRDIPSLTDFLDHNREYIVKYVPQQQAISWAKDDE